MVLILVGALIIGLTMGLLGSGGSILTVPILVYLLHQPEKVAVAGSLAIVGAISLVACLPYVMRNNISWRNVLFFGVPGMLGTYAGAWLSQYLPGWLQLAIFALVMLIAAVFMLRAAPEQAAPNAGARSIGKIGLDGLAVGVLTGVVGVGGGFLIIPALVVLGNVAMHQAIGTSLAIIALKSATGFAKYHHVLSQQQVALDWPVISIFSAVGIIGSLAGAYWAARLPQQGLRQAFGALLIVMGLFILVQTALRG